MKLSTDNYVQDLSRLRAGEFRGNKKINQLISERQEKPCATDKPFSKRSRHCTNVGVKTSATFNKDRLSKASLLYRNHFPKL